MSAQRPGDWCECAHARAVHGETGTCLGNHRIENPSFDPGEADIEHAECYCTGFVFWYSRDEEAS